MAFLELSDVEERLESAAAVEADAEKTLEDLWVELEQLRSELEVALDRLRNDVGKRGVAVREAAEYLNVSQPTVRAWLHHGVLEPVAGSKPIRVEPESLRRAQRLLIELRERGQDRAWLQTLVDYLHDAEARQRPSVRAGLDEFHRGQTAPA